MDSPPVMIVVPALFLSAGVVFSCAVIAAIVGTAGRRIPLYLVFSVLCLCVGMFQISEAIYYQANSAPEAVAALRWQVTSVLVFIPVLFAFVNLYTGQRFSKTWITIVTLISSLLLIVNFITPYSLRFTSLDQTAHMQLPWGEMLTRFYGAFGVGNILARVFFTSVIFWAIWRTIVQYRLGAQRPALYLGISIVLLMLASIWGLLIDLEIINSFYIGGFANLGIVLLMSLYFGNDYREQNERLEVTSTSLRREIEQRKKIEQMIKQCAVSVASYTGTAFMQILIEQLAGLFNAEYAFIGRLSSRSPDIVTTLAFWAHGRPAANMSYALAHTPCANVVNGRTCVYPQGVREQFPQDHLLAELGVDSYIGTPLFDADGQPLGLVAVLDEKPRQDASLFIDILEIFSGRAATEIQRMQAEEALETAEERLRATIEYTPNVAIQWYDQDGRVIFWNPASETMYGWRKEEALGKTLDQLIFTPAETAAFIANCQEVQRSGKPAGPIEYKIRRRDGSHGTIISTIFALPESGGQPCFVCTDFDITERCRIEAKLRQHQIQLRTLASEITIAEEQERRRIAIELHDDIIQDLGLSKIKLGELSQRLSADDCLPVVEETRSLIEHAIKESRSLVFELSLPILYELGFEAAIKWLAEQTAIKLKIPCEVWDDGQPKPMNKEMQVVLFKAVRELMNNICKHAQAHEVNIFINRTDGKIDISVQDDGVGFNPTQVELYTGEAQKFGLFGIRERLNFMDGFVKISSAPGAGTNISLTAPLAPGGQ